VNPAPRAKILCVDDEPRVLEGLAANLRRRFDVATATNGPAALAILAAHAVSVVVSDLRMPGMDGVELLAKMKEAAPDTTRILLTGQADMETSIAAVNTGQIFRFLRKPCKPEDLAVAIGAGVEQHRLVTAERELLGQTLRGTVQALLDVLSLTNPVAFGHATHLRVTAAHVARLCGFSDTWALDVAALFSQLGSLALMPETVERLYAGERLSAEEEAAAARGPEFVEKLFANIPRLEVVRGIVRAFNDPSRVTDPVIRKQGQILRVVYEHYLLEIRGTEPDQAMQLLQLRGFDPELLARVSDVRGFGASRYEPADLPLSKLVPGMMLAGDLKTRDGLLLARKGYEVTESFVTRARAYGKSIPDGMLKVFVPREL
jgi:CheY-like chemotaxis protein